MIIRHLIEPLSHAFKCLCSQTFIHSFVYSANSYQELGTRTTGMEKKQHCSSLPQRVHSLL